MFFPNLTRKLSFVTRQPPEEFAQVNCPSVWCDVKNICVFSLNAFKKDFGLEYEIIMWNRSSYLLSGANKEDQNPELSYKRSAQCVTMIFVLSRKETAKVIKWHGRERPGLAGPVHSIFEKVTFRFSSRPPLVDHSGRLHTASSISLHRFFLN